MTVDWGAPGWRESLGESLQADWDIVIVGGGITGAGIFREAAKRGLRTLLIEQNDFSSGTSSRSSKLVHGGLRYLATGEWRLTVHSVRERERLLEQAPGLVERQAFLVPVRRGQKPGWWAFRAGLAIYDRIARRRLSRVLGWHELRELAPALSTDGLRGVCYMEDARTDDARLVLRLLQEGRHSGGLTVNYLRCEGFEREQGRVSGLRWRDRIDDRSGLVRAGCVINATGAWAAQHGGAQAPRMRPLRGSHLLIDPQRLPLPLAVSWMHPVDGRPVFAYEWEGASLIGTTDLDHGDDLDTEPHISQPEVDYLLGAAAAIWPSLRLGPQDVIASYAGVRPVVASGADRPSDESRDTAMWREPGIVHVTGGKLTTFRLTALEVLAAVADETGRSLDLQRGQRIMDGFSEPDKPSALSGPQWRRLLGRYGDAIGRVLDGAPEYGFERVAGTPFLWAELAYCARYEAVENLQDLLLRRTRLGLVVPGGCAALLPRIRELCQPLLAWSDRRWDQESRAWLAHWEQVHAPSGAES